MADDDIDKIAEFLGRSVYDFVAEYTDIRENRNGLTLTEKEGTTTCVFLDGINCRINPVQCAGFPNEWNFKGWRKACEAIPVAKTE